MFIGATTTKPPSVRRAIFIDADAPSVRRAMFGYEPSFLQELKHVPWIIGQVELLQ
jgi:hypothetical protein